MYPLSILVAFSYKKFTGAAHRHICRKLVKNVFKGAAHRNIGDCFGALHL